MYPFEKPSREHQLEGLAVLLFVLLCVAIWFIWQQHKEIKYFEEKERVEAYQFCVRVRSNTANVIYDGEELAAQLGKIDDDCRKSNRLPKVELPE